MHHFFVLPAWIGVTVALGVCGAALWTGGREERITAVAFLLGWAVTLLLRDRSWAGTQWGGFAADVGVLIVVAIVALRSERYWPLFASGFQLLGVVTHGARLLDRTVGAWAYITAGVIWTWLLMAALAVGAYNRWREKRQLAAITAFVAEPGATRR